MYKYLRIIICLPILLLGLIGMIVLTPIFMLIVLIGEKDWDDWYNIVIRNCWGGFLTYLKDRMI